MDANRNKLEELLLERGLLKAQQLEYVQRRAAEQQKTIDEVITEEHLVYPEPLAQLKAEAVGMPYVDLQAVQVDPAAMQGVTGKAAATYKFIAFGQTDGKLQVALANPEDWQVLEAVRFVARKKGLGLEIYCASAENIEQALKPSVKVKVDQALRDFGQELAQTAKNSAGGQNLKQIMEDAPVSKVFAVIMRHAIEGLASDVHIEPCGNDLRVRYRINGQLHTTLLLPMSLHRALVSRVKILANMQINISRAPQESRFNFNADRQTYSVRVATLPTIYGEKITLHLIDTSKAIPSFIDLGLVGWPGGVMKDFLRDPRGLVLVAGSDGSGKSTTINAMLAALNSPGVSMATVEQTIEYELPGIAQTQVVPAEGLSGGKTLQTLLRQDIEIIMVEEISNQRIARLLTKGALAGRLMISGVNAPDALQAIPQLIDLGVSPYVLSSTLSLIVAQRLVPKLCKSCRETKVVPAADKGEVQELLRGVTAQQMKSYGVANKLVFYQSKGCPVCHEKKTLGQVAIYEVIPVSRELARVIANNGSEDELKEAAAKTGYLTIKQDGLLKALQGLVLFEDVVRAAP